MDVRRRDEAAELPSGTLGKSDRLVSLDAFRGLTVAFMVLVSNPGSAAIYRPLDHSPWNGWTITDVVFPSFLWIVGVAITLSLGKRLERGVSRPTIFAQACRRALILYLLGLLIYAIPNFSLGSLRLLGVLQRIAICYLAGTAIYLTARLRTQILWLVGILVTYWLAMKLIPVPGFGAGNLSVEGKSLRTMSTRLYWVGITTRGQGRGTRRVSSVRCLRLGRRCLA